MPSWKRVIVSGSDAVLNSLNVATHFTASGLIYPSADSGEFSFIQTDGNGNLSFQYVNTIYETIVNGEATTIEKGTPVYVSGSQGANSIVYRAAAANPSKMPAIYIAGDNIASGEEGRGITLGLITGVDTTGYSAGTEVFVGPAGGWTSTRPTGSVIIQSLGIVTKEGAGGQGVVLNPGPANLPNLLSGSVWVGNSNGYPTAVATASLSVLSSSFAVTAAYVAGASSFPFTGSAGISGSLSLVGPSTLNGNVQITGSATNALLVKGSGATSATNTLRIENSAGTPSLIILDNNSGSYNGNFSFTGSLNVRGNISQTSTANTATIGSSISFVSSNGNISAATLLNLSIGQGSIYILRSGNITATSGDIHWLAFNTGGTSRSFTPTTGSATMNGIYLPLVVSQSVAAIGVTRGLYVNPTLTSAASWRSVEWSNNIGFGLYGSGSAQNLLRGNLHIGSFVTASNTLSVAGTTRLSSSFNTAISGSTLTVIGSGSAQPIFTVQGSQGELFSVTDSLSGSLFSVNDISGLPIMEVFSDNTILMGDYQDPMLLTTKKITQTNSGSFIVYSIPTASYDGAFIDYTIKSGSNARAGTIMSTWAGSSIVFSEVDTTDIGDTTAVGLTMILSGSNAVMTGSSSTGAWTIRTIIRTI